MDVTEAHARLAKDLSIQFRFAQPAPPTPPTPPHAPDPLSWLGIGSWLFWGIVAVAVVALLAVVVQRARGRGLPRLTQASAPPPESALGIVPAAVLQDADLLAERGEYGAAVHALLLRGIGAIQQRFPRILTPAHTSRDIAALAALPAPLRTAFAEIAGLAERAVFAQRPLGRAEWEASRASYAGLLGPQP